VENTQWAYKNLRSVHLELSTLCNSICPWCPRYVDFSPNVNPNIVEGAYTLERFKRHFPRDFIQQIEFWTFAGDYGDPCTCPEILDIIEYILSIKDCKMQINTNGGMRNTKFWQQLGELMRGSPDETYTQYQKRYVIFSVDGLEDTNHIYRRNVKWHKVISAMETYGDTGARGIWEFLKFKHNEHQKEEVLQLAKKLGFPVRFKNPNGFEGAPMPAKDKDYNISYEIYPAKWPRDGDGTLEQIPIKPLEVTDKQLEFIKMINADNSPIKYKDVAHILEQPRSGCINCQAKTFGAGNEIRINHDGTVWPCSFFGHLSSKYLKGRIVSVVHRFQALGILEGIQNNLDNNTLKEILDNDPFRKVYESWDDNSVLLCSHSCGQEQNTMEKIYERPTNGR
tara:strand:+ start:36 stop:1220 length:1185 start_codon:yes stop_codon:yes gene_type:complete